MRLLRVLLIMKPILLYQKHVKISIVNLLKAIDFWLSAIRKSGQVYLQFLGYRLPTADDQRLFLI